MESIFLTRESPPPVGEPSFEIGWCGEAPVSIIVEPRGLQIGDHRDADSDAVGELLFAFVSACRVLWGGKEWRAALETVADLRAGESAKWERDGIIPPPALVGWVAYLRSLPNPRAVGNYVRGAAFDDDAARAGVWGEVAAAMRKRPAKS